MSLLEPSSAGRVLNLSTSICSQSLTDLMSAQIHLLQCVCVCGGGGAGKERPVGRGNATGHGPHLPSTLWMTMLRPTRSWTSSPPESSTIWANSSTGSPSYAHESTPDGTRILARRSADAASPPYLPAHSWNDVGAAVGAATAGGVYPSPERSPASQVTAGRDALQLYFNGSLLMWKGS